MEVKTESVGDAIARSSNAVTMLAAAARKRKT
jgi:hypothetical protein